MQLPKVIPHRRLFLLAFLFIIFTSGFAQTKFVKHFRPLADSLSVEYGIPASVILGVSILESGAGTSRNCKLLNNYFGIVGKNKLQNGTKSRYKQYKDASASFVDFCHVIKKKKFYKKLKGDMNYKFWVDAISKKGYSEIPDIWKERVLNIIQKNKLSDVRY